MLGTDTLIPVAFFVTIVVLLLGLARIVSETRIRRRLIESGGSAEVARALAELAAHERAHPPALKWGIVAVAAGAAFVVLQFLPFDEDDPIMAGVVLLFVGAGLLIYHALTTRAGALHAPRASAMPGEMERGPAAPASS